MSAILADYLDGDDRLRGAGREEPNNSPGNYLAQNCWELARIEDWRLVLDEHPSFIDFCSLSRRGELNLNAVPESLWGTFWPDSVDVISSQRAQGVWISQNNPASTCCSGY